MRLQVVINLGIKENDMSYLRRFLFALVVPLGILIYLMIFLFLWVMNDFEEIDALSKAMKDMFFNGFKA